MLGANCGQCHIHPFERPAQDNYYEWTSLFSRADYKIVENDKGDKRDKREFMGRGIVDVVDDFRASNPPTHLELLDALAKDFASHGCDIRHCIRTIMAPRPYQLSIEGGDPDDGGELFPCPHPPARRGANPQLD